MIYPVSKHPGDGRDARISDGFKQRKTADHRQHLGVDIMYRRPGPNCVDNPRNLPTQSACHEMPSDTVPALAILNGVVDVAKEISNGGQVSILHADGTIAGYLHLSKILVQVGQTVSAGQPVGIVGPGGGINHLHFFFKNSSGTMIDPRPIIAGAVHIEAPLGFIAQAVGLLGALTMLLVGLAGVV